MTLSIPMWVFWIGGGAVVIVVLFFAIIGFMFAKSYRGWR